MPDHNQGRELTVKRIAEIDEKFANLTHALATGLDLDTVPRWAAEPEIYREARAPKAVPVGGKVKQLIPDADVPAARQAANESLAQDLQGADVSSLQLKERPYAAQ